MKDFTRSDLLFSLCGLNCGLCPMHLDGHCPEQVAAIVKETIQKVYPNYYPSGAVQFFLDLHSEARIFEKYPKVHIDASFPAESMYLRRGYQIASYEKFKQKTEISSAIILWKKKGTGIRLYRKVTVKHMWKQSHC